MSAPGQQSVFRRFRWIVDGVTRDKFERNGFSKDSEGFSVDLGGNKTEWTAYIERHVPGFMRVAVKLKKADHRDFLLRYDVSLGDIRRTNNRKFKAAELTGNHGWSEFIELDKLFDPSLGYIVNDRMELVYDIELFAAESPENKDEKPIKSKFFSEGLFTDFVVKSSEGKEFKVHRVYLAEASDFFATMFKIDMKEKQESSVIFDDIDSATLELVFDFIYHDKTEITNVEIAANVMYAAEKLMLSNLKSLCHDALEKKLGRLTALKILEIASMFGDKDLEKTCLKFIIDNYNAVKTTAAWKAMTVELFTKVSDAFDFALKHPQSSMNTRLY